MNIAIFTDTYYPDTNGIAVSVKTLVDSLKAHDDQVMIITSCLPDKIPSKEAGIFYIPISKKRRSILTTINIFNSTIFKQLKAFKPDVIHSETNEHIGQLGRYAATRLKLPLVYTYHVHREEYAPYVGGTNLLVRFTRALDRKYYKDMMNDSTEFIVPSVKIKNYLRRKGVDKYISVITTAIDTKKFEIDETVKKDEKYLRKKYAVEPNEKVLLYVGQLSREKSIDFLINGIKTYTDEHPDRHLKLIIVGEGDQESNLASLIKQLDLENTVILAGKVNHDKIKSYYYFSDVFVSASRSETQCITIMEALMMKRIVLAIDDESLKGIIEEEKTGFIFLDEEQFVRSLDKILSLNEKEKEAIQEAGYQKITSEYDLETYYQKTIEVYNRAKRKTW